MCIIFIFYPICEVNFYFIFFFPSRYLPLIPNGDCSCRAMHSASYHWDKWAAGVRLSFRSVAVASSSDLFLLGYCRSSETGYFRTREATLHRPVWGESWSPTVRFLFGHPPGKRHGFPPRLRRFSVTSVPRQTWRHTRPANGAPIRHLLDNKAVVLIEMSSSEKANACHWLDTTIASTSFFNSPVWTALIRISELFRAFSITSTVLKSW